MIRLMLVEGGAFCIRGLRSRVPPHLWHLLDKVRDRFAY